MYEKYLPIGTVVMLKGGKKRAMITGFCATAENDDKRYDYIGCIYPEGYISANKTLLFNHEQIEKVYYVGLIDDEERKFKLKLNELISKL